MPRSFGSTHLNTAIEGFIVCEREEQTDARCGSRGDDQIKPVVSRGVGGGSRGAGPEQLPARAGPPCHRGQALQADRDQLAPLQGSLVVHAQLWLDWDGSGDVAGETVAVRVREHTDGIHAMRSVSLGGRCGWGEG